MRKAEIACAAGVLAWAGLMLREATRLTFGWEPGGPGAGFFPFWLSLGLLVSAGLVLARALGRAAAPARDARPFIRPGGASLLLKVGLPVAGLALATEMAGFYAAAALYLGFSMRWLGRQGWPWVIGVSLLFPVAAYLVLERWFLILLPKGYLGGVLPF
jgi:hypothetical protein